MNWKSVSLSKLRWRILLLGAIAGGWGVFLHEAASLLVFQLRLGEPWAALPGMALGLGVGLLLSPIEDILNHFPLRSLRSALWGGALSALVGGVALSLAPYLPGQVESVHAGSGANGGTLAGSIAFCLMLGLISASSGSLPLLVAGSRGRAPWRMAAGFFGGGLLAIPLAAAMWQWNANSWLFLGGMSLWGAGSAFILFWWEKRFAKHWLRLLTTPGEDWIFPLAGRKLTVGKNDFNDIPLKDFKEIYPHHCELHWVKDHYDIIDNEEGGIVLVNYRQIQEQALKSGDLVKIGSAILQYGVAE